MWQIMCFGQKVKTQQNKNQTSKHPLPKPGIKARISCTQSGCVTTAPPSQQRVSIVVMLFICFDAMGWNVKKQSRICGPHIYNKYIVCVICLHAWITIFSSFIYMYLRESIPLLKYGWNVRCKQFWPKKIQASLSNISNKCH